MRKTVWIYNHYIVPPSIEDGHRHSKFAEILSEFGYNPFLFFSSYMHRQKYNLIENKNQFITYEKNNNATYIAIKTKSYKGNKISRVVNMIQYTFKIMRTRKYKKFNLSKPDIIIASTVHPLTCIAGLYVARKLKIPCIIEVRDLWPLSLIKFGKIKENSLISKIMYFVEKRIYMKADSIIFTMEGGKNYITDRNWESKINLNKVKHINNGIIIDRFNQNKKKFVYKDIDLDDSEKFKIVYTGSLGDANSVFDIIKTAERLKSKKLPLLFLIFGDGSNLEKLKFYCQEKDIDNVVFKGRVKRDYIPSILSRSNINIFTGNNSDLYEYGISFNKLFDYLASGKPTVSNLNCNFDLLKRYDCGVTVDVNQIKSLDKAIINYYYMDEKKYNDYCKNAIKAAKLYDYKELTRSLIDIIEETYSIEI